MRDISETEFVALMSEVHPQPEPQQAPAPQQMQREPPKPTCATDVEANAWAKEWWHKRSEKQNNDGGGGAGAAIYQDAAALFALLRSNDGLALEPVKLVRGSWLLRRAAKLRAAKTDAERARLRVPRRQELELEAPDALLTPKQAAAMQRGQSGDGDLCSCSKGPLATPHTVHALSIKCTESSQY